MSYTIEQRRTETVAYGATGERLGSFDRTAGASRGTLRGRVVANTYTAWLDALAALFPCICTPAIAGISDGPNVDCPVHGEAADR